MSAFQFSEIPSVKTAQARTILQRLFDRAYIGMAAQDWRFARKRPGNTCFYRHVTDVRTGNNEAPDVLKCAIGQLIDDAVYVAVSPNGPTSPERRIASDSVVLALVARSNPYGLSTIDVDTLQAVGEVLNGDDHVTNGTSWFDQMQQCHDTAHDAEEMQRKFARFAESFGLTVPVVRFNI